MLLTRREPGEQYRVCRSVPGKHLAAGGGLPNEDISDRLAVSCFLLATQEPQSHSVTQTGLQAGDVNAWRG